MEDAQWTRVKDLFAVAIERPFETRETFLAEACPDDELVRREVAALLAEDEVAATDLEALVEALAPSRIVEPEVPVQIGPWRLVREIGRGGMGTVFLAERADGQYNKRAALKLLRTGAASADMQARFRAERQLLARLDHPNIARLLDGGLTPPAPDAPDGVPYLVMEYVEGESFVSYLNARRASLDTRVALFLQVCDAVQAAHQRLVVHRDLKPSNILVAENGAASGEGEGAPTVKLLDFGIAKLVDDEALDALRTASGVRLLTPEFAAPEQLAGAPVTTATDVYALGLVLYEVLSGVRPGAGGADGQQPSRPSTALLRSASADALSAERDGTPQRLARRLRGDLDTIVLKALRDEPDQRYATAAEFAADLRRWVGHLPVHARPAGVEYRARRFVRRHRVGVTAALLTVLGLSIGLGVALWQAHLARESAAQSAATLAFLQNTLYTAEPVFGAPDATIRQALDSAAAHVDRDLADQPLVAAGVHATVGYTYFSLGFYDLSERHQRRAVALYDAAGRASRLNLGNELSNLALSLDAQGRFDEAATYFARALPLVRDLGTDAQRASVSNAYASTLDGLGRSDEAEALYREAIALWRAEQNPALPLALNNLAILYEGTRRTADAVPVVEEAARALRRGGSVERARIGPVLSTLGTLYDYTGHTQAARDTLDEALRVLDETLGPDHPKTIQAMASRALVDTRAGRFSAAQPVAREAFERAERSLPSSDPIRLHAASILGQALCGISSDSARTGTVLARAAYDGRSELYGREHFLTASTESVVGGCLVANRKEREARPLLEHAYEALRAARGDADARTRDAKARLDALSRLPP